MYRKNAGEGNRLRDMADAGILARAALPHRTWWRVVPVSALGLLAGCAPAVLDPAGPVGTANRTLLLDSLAIMLVIVVPTILATLAFAWWFRSSNPRARRLPNWAYSGQIELVTWSIPLMTIILLGGVAWVGSHELDPARPLPSKGGGPAMEVQVVALDWKWLFIYPGQKVASLNELVIPAGMPVHFTLTSASVMNAFFVPQLGSMIYVMNGMASDLNLQADKPGVFHGLSAHYSGDGFSDMHFRRALARRRRVCPVGHRHAADRPRPGQRRLRAARQAEHQRSARDVPGCGHVPVSEDRRPADRARSGTGAGADAEAQATNGGRRGGCAAASPGRGQPNPSDGTLACWVSSPGRRSRSTNRYR